MIGYSTQDDKHIGPVWVIYWLVEEDSANELSVAESLLSLGDDGYFKRWSMAKGMESSGTHDCLHMANLKKILLLINAPWIVSSISIAYFFHTFSDVMKVMRSTMQIPGRREKRNESLITTLSTAYTVCFFPDNTELFLLGTEEGFIHKVRNNLTFIPISYTICIYYLTIIIITM